MDGRVIAGPHVRNSCARHLRDLVNGPARGLRWDLAKANRVLEFFPDVLRLTGGKHEGQPFNLHDWQAFVNGSLFGWMKGEARRFRIAYIETGKGSGKSPLGAGLGVYCSVADNEPRSEGYFAAVDKDQAMIPFKDAVAMVRLSDELDAEFVFSGGVNREWHATHIPSGSSLRPISSEATGRGKSGYRPHFVLLDEVHEHPTNAMVEFMIKGTKNRRQPLVVMITNSGIDRTSVCFDYHTYGTRVAAGEIEDDSFFSYICAVDETDDPFTDPVDPALGYPKSWAKANPSIGVTFGPDYLEREMTRARGMPALESVTRRLNFCQWVDAASPWIDGDLWRACEVAADEWNEPDGPSFLALDLSRTRDLTALAQVWPGEKVHARLSFWTPADTVREREVADRAPYQTWVNGGHLEAVPGRSIDYGFVAVVVAKLVAAGKVIGLAFDQWRMSEFRNALDAVGLDSWIAQWDPKFERWVEEGKQQPGIGLMLLRHGQGFGGGLNESTLWMPRSIGALEESVLKDTLRVKLNPVLRWNSASAVLEQDAAGNKKWEKRKSTGRIDGIVALSMGVGASTGVQVNVASVYETRGVVTL